MSAELVGAVKVLEDDETKPAGFTRVFVANYDSFFDFPVTAKLFSELVFSCVKMEATQKYLKKTCNET